MYIEFKINESHSLRVEKRCKKLIYSFAREGKVPFILQNGIELKNISNYARELQDAQINGKPFGAWPSRFFTDGSISLKFWNVHPLKRHDWMMQMRIYKFKNANEVVDTLIVNVFGTEQFENFISAIDYALICDMYNVNTVGIGTDNYEILFIVSFNCIVYHLLEQKSRLTHKEPQTILANQLGARRVQDICALTVLDATFLELQNNSGKSFEFWTAAQYVANNLSKYSYLIKKVFDFVGLKWYEEHCTLEEIKWCYLFEFEEFYVETFFVVEQFFKSNNILANCACP